MMMLFPKILVVREIPLSFDSGIGNYIPPCNSLYSNQIWIQSGMSWWQFTWVLLHELGHWMIEVGTHSEQVHEIWDQKSRRISVKILNGVQDDAGEMRRKFIALRARELARELAIERAHNGA